MAEMQRVRAIRGAIVVENDTPEQIMEKTSELLLEMVSVNRIAQNDIIQIMFTATQDLTSAFPAAAARKLGWVDTPLITAVEMNVSNSLSRCIRVLMTVYTTLSKNEVVHVYIGQARSLRPDLSYPD